MLLRDIIELPLFDLNYMRSSEHVNIYSYKQVIKRRGLLVCSLAFLYSLLRSAVLWRPWRRGPEPGTVIAVVETRNQYDAVVPVVRRLRTAEVLNVGDQEGLLFPMFLAYALALLLWPLPLIRYFSANRYERHSYAYSFHHYWLTFGYYGVSRLWIRRARPSLILVSNDHNMKTRTFVRAARDEGVPTAYMQHASVTEKFPPLSVDFAFLDGLDALEKYATIGASKTVAFLAGIPKADDFYAVRNSNLRVQSVGICVNVLDSTQRVLDLCEKIVEFRAEIDVAFRPHPGDRRDWPSLLSKYRIEVSEPREELSFAFLQRVDVIVVANSNIALEALLMNVGALYYDFDGRGADGYGFVRRGTIPYFRTIQDVLNRLAELRMRKPDVRIAAKPFCATIGTSFDGASSDLVSTTIVDLLRNEINRSNWRRIHEQTALVAFHPRDGAKSGEQQGERPTAASPAGPSSI